MLRTSKKKAWPIGGGILLVASVCFAASSTAGVDPNSGSANDVTVSAETESLDAASSPLTPNDVTPQAMPTDVTPALREEPAEQAAAPPPTPNGATLQAEPSPSPAIREEPTESKEGDEASPAEKANLGLVLGLAKGTDIDGPKLAFGLRGGVRLHTNLEAAALVTASGQFGDLAIDTIPILFQLNAVHTLYSIHTLAPTLSVYAGAQIGTVYYRMSTDAGGTSGGAASGGQGIGSQEAGAEGGIQGMYGLAYGLQAGAIAYLSQDFVLRLEAAWLHAGEATTTSGDTTYGTDPISFLNLQLAIGYLFH